MLTNHRPRRFVVNAEALGYVEAGGLSAVRRRQLAQVPGDVIMDEAMLQALLETHLPGLGPQQRQWILDARAHKQLRIRWVRGIGRDVCAWKDFAGRR